MDGRHITAIIIIAIVMIASVLRAKYRDRHRNEDRLPRESAETERLREEVKMLKERLQVLERIAVEKENSLEREIEALRDR